MTASLRKAMSGEILYFFFFLLESIVCFRDLSVVIFGDSFKAFGFRLNWYLNGRLVGIEVLQEKNNSCL